MRWVAVVGFLTCGTQVLAQGDSTYTPGHTYNWKSRVLLARLNGQLENELNRNGLTIEMPMAKYYRSMTDELRKKVRDSSFLDYRDIQWLLDDTYRRLRESNPGLLPTPKTLLAFRHPLPNAYSVGEGTILVTTGMLSRMQNQSQLAAVLAHELAHYELNHVWKGIQLQDAVEQQAKLPAPSKTGDPTVDRIQELKQLTIYLFNEHKEWELEADSLAFIYFTNAGFRQSEFITMLALLDPEGEPADHPLSAFFAPLNFSRYPFQEQWLRPRAAIYGKSPWDFFLPEDALRTHPEITRRAEKLLPYLKEEGQVTFVDPGYLRKVSIAAQLESAEAGSTARQLDMGLHEALLGLHSIPGNPHLVTAMGRILLRSATVKQDNLLVYHLPISTTGYDRRMLLSNNMLNNITVRELTELGYHFMNKKENFNDDVQEHYYLLWSFCKLSGRNETRKGVEEEYRSRFPKGRYARTLKER